MTDIVTYMNGQAKPELKRRIISIGQAMFHNPACPIRVVTDFISAVREQFPEFDDEDMKEIVYRIFHS